METSDTNKLTREALYELVWSTPLTTLAKNYNISDNGLRKICIKLAIPLPKSGYWSKIKFNKLVKKIPLPKNTEVKQEINIAIRDKDVIIEEHPQTAYYRLIKEIENTPNLPLKVPDILTKPHKFTKATSIYHQQIKIRSRKRDWSMKVDDTNVLSINVSDKIFPRALRFIDSLVKLIEKRGYRIEAAHSTIVTIKNHSYNIRLTEKNKRVKRLTDNSWDSFDRIPTGNLSLKIDHSYPIKEWSDSKTKLIEDKLVDILAWLELRAKKDEVQKIESDLWHRKQENIRIEKEALQKKKDEELAKFETLFQTATRWHKSQYIRNYIKEFQEYATKTNSLDEEKKQWIEWAIEKADWYDPFIVKNVDLLEDIDRETLKSKRNRYW